MVNKTFNGLFVLVMTIFVSVNKGKFLTKIYLYNDYFEIKNNSESITIANIKVNSKFQNIIERLKQRKLKR